ncbi:MAG: hypothetical protein HY606_02990, partial [Planctomycetes bacterium]|nr:hypothetical protein [Planctomycetota bacterium]
ASWCAPCQLIQVNILNNDEIKADLEGFILLKMDVSNSLSRNSKRMIEVYKIINPPAIVFYNSKGQLVDSPRFVTYNFTLEDLRKALKKID